MYMGSFKPILTIKFHNIIGIYTQVRYGIIICFLRDCVTWSEQHYKAHFENINNIEYIFLYARWTSTYLSSILYYTRTWVYDLV